MAMLPALSLVTLFTRAVFAQGAIPDGCRNTNNYERKACTQPIEHVVTITPGSSYTAKARCYDCSPSGDYDMLFNITLSNDNRTVLLNESPFFPKLSTIPKPPTIYVPQVRPEFSYGNLSFALECRAPLCRPETRRTLVQDGCMEWCDVLQLDSNPIDYLYIAKPTEYNAKDANEKALYWEFSIDAIGKYGGYPKHPDDMFDNPSQKMLKVVIEGIESGKGGQKGEKDMQAGSSLFGPFGEEEKIYDYRIVDVSLVEREFKFPTPKSLSFGQKVSRFFGNDIWQEEDRRLVFIGDEWGLYGKEGTLRNMFGNVVHWYLWGMVFIIIASAVGSILFFIGSYKLYFWIQQQRELMKWNGMDDVWDKLRREREEEENALLNGGYRDEPEEGGSSRPARYTDDLDRMKPLPTKPLPEKPLPDVPLIDA